MRLSPSGKESRPYPLKQGDVLQFGVDFKGKNESMNIYLMLGIYRAVTVKLGFHDQSWLVEQRANANPERFANALKQLLAATNPYGEKNAQIQEEEGNVDCCICIGKIAPFQALFIAPCSHCYHFKCVQYLIAQSAMFQCPLCRQVANLTASVSSDSLNVNEPPSLPVLLSITLLNLGEVADGSDKEKSREVPIKHSILQNLGLMKPPAPAPKEEEHQQELILPSLPEAKPKKSFSMKFRSLVGGKQNGGKELMPASPQNARKGVPKSELAGPRNGESSGSRHSDHHPHESDGSPSLV
jgi:Zn finger protein HypA/HybF involved in hydrogenase expression